MNGFDKGDLMKIISVKLMDKARSAFRLERIICRVIASWSSFAAINLFGKGDIDYNEISMGQDVSLLKMAMIILAFFVGYTVVNILLSRFESDSWFLLLSATVCVTKWLLSTKDFLVTLAIAIVYSLFCIYFVFRNRALLRRWQPKAPTVWICAAIFGTVCGFVIGGITCYRYLTFSSPNFDFGIFVNMFHHMKETGLPFVTSERDVLLSHFVVHISPIFYLILPIYYIFPSPLTLQVAQAVVLASGIVPVVLLCRHFKLSGKATVLLSLIYALYPAITAGTFYDMHENCFLTPLLLWLFFFFEKEKYIPMYVFALLTLAVKEDAAIYIVLFALFVIFSKKKYVHGAALALGAIAYFAIALGILESSADKFAEFYANSSPNPAISGPMVNRFNNLMINKEDGLMGVLKTALTNPGYLLTQLFTTNSNGWEKIRYFLEMMLPLGFIPFCTKKPSRWLLIAPLLMNLLTRYQYQYDIGYQYNFAISAFLIYATIMNIPDLKSPTRKTLITIATVACCCIYITTAIANFDKYQKRWSENKDYYKEIDEVLDTIPEDASVTASAFLVPHLADRDVIYQTTYHLYDSDVDYVVIDMRYEKERARIFKFKNMGFVVENELEGRLTIMKNPKNVQE